MNNIIRNERPFRNFSLDEWLAEYCCALSTCIVLSLYLTFVLFLFVSRTGHGAAHEVYTAHLPDAFDGCTFSDAVEVCVS